MKTTAVILAAGQGNAHEIKIAKGFASGVGQTYGAVGAGLLRSCRGTA